MRILILGVTGMLGNAMFRMLSEDPALTVFGSARSDSAKSYFKENLRQQIVCGVDVEHHDSLVSVFGKVRPEVVINCIGLVKQVVDVEDPLQAIPINTILPHRLAALCKVAGARLVHISTDCVFAGAKGNYVESDFPDANDLYGRSKLLGDVVVASVRIFRAEGGCAVWCCPSHVEEAVELLIDLFLSSFDANGNFRAVE